MQTIILTFPIGRADDTASRPRKQTRMLRDTVYVQLLAREDGTGELQLKVNCRLSPYGLLPCVIGEFILLTV